MALHLHLGVFTGWSWVELCWSSMISKKLICNYKNGSRVQLQTNRRVREMSMKPSLHKLKQSWKEVKTPVRVDCACLKDIHLIKQQKNGCFASYLIVVVDESFPTAILCSPSLICWAQYGCSHATQDTWPAYTMGIIQFSILSSLKK